MAKKNIKKKDNQEVVAKCDNPKEVVTNCDNLIVNEETFSQSDIEKMIITIRGMQVMIDRDLARVYKVTTSQLNQQVKRNIARFPMNFRFQLTTEEMNNLKSQIVTSSWGGTRKLPYAFTEPGIAQLSSVLHSEKAIETSVKIMILDKMEENSPKLLPEQIFQTGCVWDAWSYVSDLVRSAKHRIALIDNFVDDRVLTMLDKRAEGVSATIHSRYYEQFQTDLKKHNEQYPAVEFVQLPHKNHDRFLIIDDKVYLMGASLKDMGAGLCVVTEMQISPEIILGLLK